VVPIVTTIFIRTEPDDVLACELIMEGIETLQQRRVLAIDGAPGEFTERARALGHRIWLATRGRAPRMLWNMAEIVIGMKPRPVWFATIEQDVAVSERSFFVGCEVAEGAPIAVGAFGLAFESVDEKPREVSGPAPDGSLANSKLQELRKARFIPWVAAFWRTEAFLKCDLFHCPPLDWSDMAVCQRLRRQGYSIFTLPKVPCRHYVFLSTRHFR
jgi:hypothetical protein